MPDLSLEYLIELGFEAEDPGTDPVELLMLVEQVMSHGWTREDATALVLHFFASTISIRR